ncbi:MAG: hypothetical protein A3K59_07025 [Euryarchaeota archaeon RBG_19FT_COMBO_69_17]|nr:MAG: hypothetical protein A3K59_07025 [Euryarchaeota archaeon RBG_19FT_COMBO_69_17]
MTAAKTPGVRPRVLVVDDDRGMRENLSELLASAGYDVVTASNTNDALTVIASGDVDLLLTDLRMPGPNGLELIRSARQRRPDLRAILMTAFGNGFTEVEVVRRGGIGYLQKPFEADEVTGLVDRILSLDGE